MEEWPPSVSSLRVPFQAVASLPLCPFRLGLAYVRPDIPRAVRSACYLLLLVSSLAYYSTLKMEALYSSETSGLQPVRQVLFIETVFERTGHYILWTENIKNSPHNVSASIVSATKWFMSLVNDASHIEDSVSQFALSKRQLII
jgi:hypothetical protein